MEFKKNVLSLFIAFTALSISLSAAITCKLVSRSYFLDTIRTSVYECDNGTSYATTSIKWGDRWIPLTDDSFPSTSLSF